MFKFIGKALAGLLLTDDARKAVTTKPETARKSASQSTKAKAAKNGDAGRLQEQAKTLITEDRAELIRNAMRVRAAKQTILADLNDEDRAKLVATAMKALLNEGREKKE